MRGNVKVLVSSIRFDGGEMETNLLILESRIKHTRCGTDLNKFFRENNRSKTTTSSLNYHTVPIIFKLANDRNCYFRELSLAHFSYCSKAYVPEGYEIQMLVLHSYLYPTINEQ